MLLPTQGHGSTAGAAHPAPLPKGAGAWLCRPLRSRASRGCRSPVSPVGPAAGGARRQPLPAPLPGGAPGWAPAAERRRGPLRGSGEGEPSPRTLISHELMCFSHLFLCTSPSCALPRAHTRARPRSLALCRGLAGGGTGAGRTGASGAAMGNTPSQGMSLSLCAPILK